MQQVQLSSRLGDLFRRELAAPVGFNTAANWITRLANAHHIGQLDQELKRVNRYQLIIVDEVGYLPFDTEAANLFFQLVSTRYEHTSIILTSNLAFSQWGQVFGDQMIAAAMIDRIVHHADVITLKGASYRMKHTQINTLPSIQAEQDAQCGSPRFPDSWLFSFRRP